MIVVITSLASVYAFSAPESRPEPPPTAPAGLGDDQRDARDRPPEQQAAQSVRSQDPDDQLALCPDVEQPGAEREPTRNPGESAASFSERQPGQG